jgi:hypothetical protein
MGKNRRGCSSSRLYSINVTEKLKKAGHETDRKRKEPLPIPQERLQKVSANVASVSA